MTWMAVLMVVFRGGSEDFRVVELTEQLLLRRAVFRDWTADPGDVHVVLPRDVLVRDVAAPDPAPHARRHRHAVRKGAGVRARLHLPHHYPADRRGQCQTMDVVIVKRVDAAGVSLAAGLENLA